jgi:hypothetical protein
MEILNRINKIISTAGSNEDAAALIIQLIEKQQSINLKKNSTVFENLIYELVLKRAEGDLSITMTLAISISKDLANNTSHIEIIKSLLLILSYFDYEINPDAFYQENESELVKNFDFKTTYPIEAAQSLLSYIAAKGYTKNNT